MSLTPSKVGPDGIVHALAYQPALDGIRALAVTLVVVFHFGLQGMHGGFLGVDIFFGLSGFLITTLLLREHAATGTIKLASFWVRRFRRLLPGLLVMVAVSVLASWLLLVPSYYPSLGRDALAAIFYFTNWHLIGIRASYFNTSVAPTIVTHTWSLSIEEQFYWVWPILALVALRFRRSIMLALCAGGALLSALAMVQWYGHRSNARIYFGTDTHVQGLLIGAAAAVLAWYLERRSTTISRLASLMWLVVGVTSLAGILVIVRYSDGNSPFLFRGGFFLFGILVALLILSLRCAPESLLARTCGLPPLAYLGRISYSVYLWHYPVYSLVTHYRTGLDGFALFGFRLFLTGLLALTSYYIVELPIRRRTLSVSMRHIVPAVAVVVVVAASSWWIGTNAARVPGYPVNIPPSTDPTVHSLTIGDSGIMTFSWATMAQRGAAGVDDYSDAAYGCGLVGGTYPLFKGMRSVQNPDCQMQRDGNWPLREKWQIDIARRRPDVVVVAAGRWESHNQKIFRNIHSIEEPSFRRMIVKSLDLIRTSSTAVGASVILVTTPCAHSGETSWGNYYVADTPARINAYNTLIRQYATTYGLAIYDLGGMVCPGGKFTYFIDQYMVRAPDGFHYANGSGPVLGQEYWNNVRAVGLRSTAWSEKIPGAR